MANEAVTLTLSGYPDGVPIRFACAEGTGIEKGTLLVLSGANRVAATEALDVNLPFAGIAATEYAVDTAVSGAGTIGVYTQGTFDLVADSAGTVPTAGALCVISGANTIAIAADGDYEKGMIVGKALELGVQGSAGAVALGIY